MAWIYSILRTGYHLDDTASCRNITCDLFPDGCERKTSCHKFAFQGKARAIGSPVRRQNACRDKDVGYVAASLCRHCRSSVRSIEYGVSLCHLASDMCS